ncbi:hypothetical protein KFZ58_05395 [Virgibacillus sp. NKC19-16]|uniref:hypothetical protein n=1 Tax=Virgibacillus salidurans TaxID=2831673 RepID=UPI001F47BD6E|nr:hypothetical protein [Virgibacillus sp. NKC19-16]UJL47328.1 hypothetical protein KFZ58_05395 [Virgibacillus sp. NKC19-16]
MKAVKNNSVYFPDKEQEDLLGVLDEIFYFLIQHFAETIMEETEHIISRMNISDTLAERIFPQLVWWTTFCSPIGSEKITIFQHYLQLNKHRFENKGSFTQDVLVSWLSLNPGFYHVLECESESDRVFIFKDVFGGDTKIVRINQRIFLTPKRGEIITGLLIPMGNATYITQGGLFHIPEELAQKVLRKIIPYFKKHAISTDYDFNPQLYPSLAMITLNMMEKVYEK